MDDDEETCASCNGSGEGMHDGTNCAMCGGSGTDKPKASDKCEDCGQRKCVCAQLDEVGW